MPLKTGRAYAAYGKSFMRTNNYGSRKVAPPNFICPAIKNKPFELAIQAAMCKKENNKKQTPVVDAEFGRARALGPPDGGGAI